MILGVIDVLLGLVAAELPHDRANGNLRAAPDRAGFARDRLRGHPAVVAFSAGRGE